MPALFESVEALNAQPELFHDPNRSLAENEGPFLLVCDDFYPDPHAIRELALQQDFYQYKPPLAEQVGEAVAAEYQDRKPVWLSSSLMRHQGQEVKTPQRGYRHNNADVRELLSNVIPDEITMDTWYESGDWWNGAFHLQYQADSIPYRRIHHHYREGDVAPIGWSGLVYLSPDAPPENGTTIWREKSSGRCIASKGNKYDADYSEFELALEVENHFNRLVLFRENVLHLAGFGYGETPETARLMQTFFFMVNRNR